MAYKDKNDPRNKEARLRWYYKNKKKQITKQISRANRNRAFIKRYKGFLRCKDCNISFKREEYLCDFHHLKGDDKVSTVSQMPTYSLKMIKEEIRKCVPLCPTCHRRRHKGNLFKRV